jgi:hypothetical protein
MLYSIRIDDEIFILNHFVRVFVSTDAHREAPWCVMAMDITTVVERDAWVLDRFAKREDAEKLLLRIAKILGSADREGPREVSQCPACKGRGIVYKKGVKICDCRKKKDSIDL